MHGDWYFALAAYNAGPGNVNKAIRRSGGKTNYWEVRPFLPKETRNYVPNFIAVVYLMEYHATHGIFPKNPCQEAWPSTPFTCRDRCGLTKWRP